jgi:hypothetical protein
MSFGERVLFEVPDALRNIRSKEEKNVLWWIANPQPFAFGLQIISVRLLFL